MGAKASHPLKLRDILLKGALALLLAIACVPAEALATDRQAWGSTWGYAVFYQNKDEDGYTLVLQSSSTADSSYGQLVQCEPLDGDSLRVYKIDSELAKNTTKTVVKDPMQAPQSLSSCFSGMSKCTLFDLEKLDTSQVTDMGDMFYDCSSLGSIDLSGLDTSNVYSMAYMFCGCSSLESADLSGLDVSAVGSMECMFDGCSSLESLDLSGLDTSNVGDMNHMFDGCSSLKAIDLSGLDASNVHTMAYMFCGCSSLESADLSGLDASQATDMDHMFYGCSSLKAVDLSEIDTSNARDMRCMFGDCSSLKAVDLSEIDTSQVTDMRCMFDGCSSLESIDLSGLDASAVESMYSMFYGCSALSRVVLPSTSSQKISREPPDKTWVHESGRSFTPGNFPEGLGGLYTAADSSPGTDVPGTSEPGEGTPNPPTSSDTPNETPQPAPPISVNPPASSDNPVAAPQPTPSTSTQPAQPTSLAKAQVTVKSKAYTGKTLKPASVTVKVGGKKLVSGRDYTVSCKGGKAVGSYKVTIKGKGAYTGTKTATFKILPKATSVSKTKAAKRGFTVAWKKPSKTNLKQTAGYKVQWSTDKNFKKAVKSKLVKKNKTTSLKVSKLKGGKKYYVRVCAYKKVGSTYYYSAWSKAKAVKTKK